MTRSSTAPNVDADPHGNPLRSWLSVISVAVAAFAFVTTEYLPVGILPQIANDLHISEGTAGLMVTAPGILAAISAPAMMFGAGRIDRRFILLALTMLLLASNLVAAFSTNFTVMLLGRALLGVSLGGFWTVALAASGRLVAEARAAKAMVLIFTGITFATVLGVPFGTFLSNLFTWRAAFIATSLLVAVALVAQAILLPALPSKGSVSIDGLLALLRRSNPRKSILLVLLVIGAHFTSYTYIAPFLVQGGVFSLPMISAILLGFGIVGMVANFAISGPAGKNLQASLFWMVLLMMLVLMALPLLQGSAAGLVVAVLVWGVAFGAIPLCLSLWLQHTSPDLPEAGSAMLVTGFQVATALGSFGGGVVVDRVGVPATLWMGAALALVSLLLIASFGVNNKRLVEQLATH
ncbi:MFS transporter [Pseudomonas sp.]|uniref:MFS transporter n=1 Tax=Pseudomonas sp. TaxID=306 RepID=UPI0026077FE5|nr:MFS transporter [Pseudomonas sp.]